MLTASAARPQVVASPRGTCVSVVIPTRNREELVCRAVRSALAQTLAPLEVVVVVDGPDPETERTLASLGDSRVRVRVLPSSVGGAEARNHGVRAAAGEWIGFLDDDDEWLPHKLERQMEAAARSPHAYPILCSQLIARSPLGEYVWPRRMPAAGEPLSEYLFVRRGLFQGEGVIQSTMLLAPRELLLRVPFAGDLPCHQDWDWILRAVHSEGVGIDFISEPLAIWYIEESRQSISHGSGWRHSLEWIDRSRNVVTPRAYSAFIMTSVSARAAREGRWAAFLPLLLGSIRYGRPRRVDFLIFFGIWLVPQRARWWLRALTGGTQRT